MKEELQDKLVDILTNIQDATGKASDFALSQLPDVAQSYVAYGRVYTTLVMAVAALMVVTGLLLIISGFAKRRDADSDWEAAVLAFEAKGDLPSYDKPRRHEFPDGSEWMAVGGVVGGIGTAVSAISLGNFLLVWLAPKVWLLKALARMAS